MDQGEVRPTPAFRLLRVGAELCVSEPGTRRYQGNTVFFVRLGGRPTADVEIRITISFYSSYLQIAVFLLVVFYLGTLGEPKDENPAPKFAGLRQIP